MLGPKNDPHWANITPAQLDTEYLQAASARNQYVSSIAGSLVGICSRAQSDALKQTFSQLRVDTTIPEEGQQGGPSVADYAVETHIKALVKVKLWEVMHRNLVRPAPASRLSPLQLSVASMASLEADSDLLDGTIDDSDMEKDVLAFSDEGEEELLEDDMLIMPSDDEVPRSGAAMISSNWTCNDAEDKLMLQLFDDSSGYEDGSFHEEPSTQHGYNLVVMLDI